MENKNETYDLIAIGDVVVDEFIKLKEAEVQGVADSPDYKICVPFSAKIPYEDAILLPAVGNAANAAVSASRLGLKTAFISNIGDDKYGKDCLSSLEKDGVSTEFIKTNIGARTNYQPILWYGSERTIFVKHEGYPYQMPEINSPKWFYFSSVNEKDWSFHDTVADYLSKHPEIKFAFQPGTLEIKAGVEKLSPLFKESDIFFCNVEEAEKILGKEYTAENLDIKTLLKDMRELGPQIVVITDGPKGAYSYDGSEFLFMPAYPDPKPPYERTGAGDAFSSTVVEALILGKTLGEALAWGGINSMSVVQYVGAQEGLLSREKLEEYLKNAPESYKAKKLE